jgi:ribosomal protein S27E
MLVYISLDHLSCSHAPILFPITENSINNLACGAVMAQGGGGSALCSRGYHVYSTLNAENVARFTFGTGRTRGYCC